MQDLSLQSSAPAPRQQGAGGAEGRASTHSQRSAESGSDFTATLASSGTSGKANSFWHRGTSKLPGLVKPIQPSSRLIGAGFAHGAGPLSPSTSQGKLNPTAVARGKAHSFSEDPSPRRYDDFIEATNDDWNGTSPWEGEDTGRTKLNSPKKRDEEEKDEKGKQRGTAVERQIERDVLALNKKMARIEKFKAIIDSPNVDLAALRKLGWGGIPDELRPMTWQLLLGYLPCNADRRLQTLARKRKEYEDSVNQNYAKGQAGLDQALWHQIHIDVPRTNPGVPLYQCRTTQECLERVLYCWAIRHPASGYVQGINDLCTPFFQVFLSAYIDNDDPENFDTSRLPKSTLTTVEADTFWCLTKLLDSIQDNYTFAQPGIQRQVGKLKELVARIDAPLSAHLQAQEVEFIQFAFRWMNCLLMRELSLKLTIRMWDTYLAEGSDGFAGFHLYVCGAFLVKWSEKLRSMDFQGIMMYLQSLPTSNWEEKDIELLLSEAYMWQTLFQNAQSHLATPS